MTMTMKTLYKYILCVMLFLVGSMNVAWASDANYSTPSLKWIPDEGCFEFEILSYHNEEKLFFTNRRGWVDNVYVSLSVDGGNTYKDFYFYTNSSGTTGKIDCKDPSNGVYGPVYVYGDNSWSKMSSTTTSQKPESRLSDRHYYNTVRWFPTKEILGVTLDKNSTVKFKFSGNWHRENSGGNTSININLTGTISHDYSTTFSSNDWQIDGMWGYNLSLNTTLPSSGKYWNIAKVTPTGQSSKWVDFTVAGVSTPNVENGTFNLANHISNDGTIQMYTRVYPNYDYNTGFFYDVPSSVTLTVKNRTLTWNNVEDGNVKFYYDNQQVNLTKGQNVPKGTYAVVISSECPPSAKYGNADLEANGNKFTFSVNNDGKHTLALTGKKHTHATDAYVAPTCTEIGYTAGDHCSVCNQILTAQNEIKALGHVHQNYKCTRCGDIDAALGSLCGYNEGTITNSYTAEGMATAVVANQVIEGVSALSSEVMASGEATFRLNATQNPMAWYQTIGTDTYPVLNSSHKVVYNTYADCQSAVPYSNLNNGHTTQGHHWNEGSIVTQPTCVEVGTKTFACTFECGSTKDETLAALGHTEQVIPAVEATCVADGSAEGVKCTTCDEVLVEPAIVAALGHSEQIIPAVEATCVTPGSTEGKKCSVCDEILVESTILMALGHTPGSVQHDLFEHWYVCQTCQDLLNEEYHNHDSDDHTCSACGVDQPEQDDDYYFLVSNTRQLDWLKEYIGDYSADPSVRLVNDIVINENVMDDASTEPIAWTPFDYFYGTFDGQGHSISGLYCKDNTGNVGLFSNLGWGGIVRNLVIRDSYFEGLTVGAIAAESWHGTVENCASYNTLKGTIVGGLIGDGCMHIKNSISSCQITASSTDDQEAVTGLIMGRLQPDRDISSYYNSASVVNCYFATDSDLEAIGRVDSLINGEGEVCPYMDSMRVEKKALSAFRSGEVTYLLNESYNDEDETWTPNDENPIWRQNLLGETCDLFPVLNPTHKPVVKTSAYNYTIADGKQFGTFCHEVDVELPDAMKAFYAVYGENNRIYGTEIEDGVIPSGTPVILRKPSKSGRMSISVAEGYGNEVRALGDTCVSGHLVGLLKVKVGQTLPQGAEPNFTYTMQTIDGVQSFYLINSDKFKATQYRCYLDMGLGLESLEAALNRSVCLFEGEETGLQELAADGEATAPAYNLQGQRVQRMDRGGIYVQSDKRTMMK